MEALFCLGLGLVVLVIFLLFANTLGSASPDVELETENDRRLAEEIRKNISTSAQKAE